MFPSALQGYCMGLGELQHKTDLDLLEWVQRKAVKMLRGLEHLSMRTG